MSSVKKFKIKEGVQFTPVKKLSLVQESPPEFIDSEKISEVRSDVYDNKNTQSLEMALQHLWKLDKLERLIYLAELQKLEKLDKLDQLENLNQLSHLQELEGLKDLKNLSSLKDLKELDKLNHLIRLNHLDKLDSLKELGHLQHMEMLEMLKQLDKLIYLNKLESLKKLDKLDGLSKVEDLKILLETHSENFDKFSLLTHLEKLDNLKNLNHLEKLSDLEKLSVLVKMDRLTELKNLEKLTNLDHLHKLDQLDDLAKLERLSKLDELRYLEKLDSMQDLSKLDNLKDQEVRKSLSYLEKLDYFKGTNKQFLVKISLSALFDIFKIAAVGACLLFVMTKNVSYQTFNRLVPYLGFGEADRVNIALSILSHDLGKSDFDHLYKDVEARVKREAATLFDPSSPKGLNDYRIAENLSSYQYQNETYDLAALSKKERTEWADKMLLKFNNSYEYDIERLMIDPALQEDIKIYREASIFMKQHKYSEAFSLFSKVEHPKKFEALGFGRSYVFYMAYMNQPKELRTLLEK